MTETSMFSPNRNFPRTQRSTWTYRSFPLKLCPSVLIFLSESRLGWGRDSLLIPLFASSVFPSYATILANSQTSRSQIVIAIKPLCIHNIQPDALSIAPPASRQESIHNANGNVRCLCMYSTPIMSEFETQVTGNVICASRGGGIGRRNEMPAGEDF